ncbi:N-acetyltransferase [Leisingera daeponensis]|nr:N-acetyltransferase [Leisingera daeponensis]
MQFSADYSGRLPEIAEHFRAVFSASEGDSEGDLIAALVQEMFASTADPDLSAFTALKDGSIAGCILFTRLSYEQDSRTVFLLSPVAVRTQRQGQGIGQVLIRHGLTAMRQHGADVAVTYGDPSYYGKTGFRQITESQAAAPLPLSHPHGWQAQSLTGAELAPLRGPSCCVPALNNPVYW